MTRRETVSKPTKRTEGRSLWFEEAGCCALRDETISPGGEDEVLVRTLFSGISRGTESLVFGGRVPKSEAERMRAPYQAGQFPFPVKYGYAAVGMVEEGPEHLTGRPVFCLHPHQDRFRVPASSVHLLPQGLSPGRAILAANMETALNVVWDAGIQPGDRVAVFGAGVIGLMVAYISSRIPGTDTVVSDIESRRTAIAGRLGLGFVLPDAVPADCDILVNASASGAALASAIEHAGREARVVEASWYGDTQVEIPLGGAFHAKRLSIVCSQVGMVPPARRARWSNGRRLSKALELLADPRLENLVSGESPFETIAGDYPEIIRSTATLCHRIRY